MTKKTEIAVGNVIPIRVLEEGVDVFSLTSSIGSKKKVKTKVKLNMKQLSKIRKSATFTSKILLEVELS
jgi:hypothetical protein